MGNGNLSMHDFLAPTTKCFQWRAGNNDGKWRRIEADDLLQPRGPKQNYIWDVKIEWDIEDYDDLPIEVYTGFVISADDYSSVWKQMCAHTDLNDMDYDQAEWKIKLIGTDLTSDGPRIISTTYTGR